MAFHPNPIIRGTAAFLAGNQQRNNLVGNLNLLKGDLSEVSLFISDNAMKDLGKTVAQSASLVLGRISGEIPEADPKTW